MSGWSLFIGIRMKQKLIAACGLASLIWCSIGAVWALPVRSSPEMSPTSSLGAAAEKHTHSCCPGGHSWFRPPLSVTIEAASMPCGKEHPCCAKQRPQNPLSLPATTRVSRPDAEPFAVLTDLYSDGARTLPTGSFATESFHHFCLRSTVLRI